MLTKVIAGNCPVVHILNIRWCPSQDANGSLFKKLGKGERDVQVGGGVSLMGTAVVPSRDWKRRGEGRRANRSRGWSIYAQEKVHT